MKYATLSFIALGIFLIGMKVGENKIVVQADEHYRNGLYEGYSTCKKEKTND